MKRSSQLICLFVCFSVGWAMPLQAQRWEKHIEKNEEDYHHGEYEKAISGSEKIRKKLTRDQEDMEWFPIVLMLEAKYHLARGDISKFYAFMDEGLKQAAESYGSGSVDFADILLEGVDLYINYGDYRQAREWLDQAMAILEKEDGQNDTREGRTKLQNAQIYYGQGFYNKALTYAQEIAPYFAARATDRETIIDKESGKIVTNKLKKDERRERYREYAALLTLQADMLARRGQIHRADSAFMAAERWIDDHLSKKDLAYIRNRFYLNNMLAPTLEDVKQVYKEYDDMIDDMKKRHEEGHELILEMYEKYLTYLVNHDENNKYYHAHEEFKEIILTKYYKGSIHRFKLDLIELNANLQMDRTGKLEAKARDLLYGADVFPENYPARISLLEYLYNISIYRKAYKTAEDYLHQILSVKENIYGNASPEFHFSRLKLANHLLKYDNDLEQAVKIYQESYFGVVEKEIYKEHPDYLSIQYHLASIHEILDEYEKANDALARAQDAAREKFQKEDKEYYTSLVEIGKLQTRIGKYSEASANIMLAEEKLEDFKRDPGEAERYIDALHARASLLFTYGFYDEAEKTLKDAQKVIRKNDLEEKYDQREAIENMASLFAAIGEYRKTEELLSQYINEEERRFGSNSRRLINLLNEMARLKLVRGDYTETEKLARRAHNIATVIYGKSSTKSVPPTITLAHVYEVIGDLEKSKRLYQEAIDIFSNRFGENHLDVALAEARLAVVEYSLNPNNDQVSALLKKAQEKVIKVMGRKNPAYAEINKNLAILLTMQGKYEEAFRLLDEAALIWEERLNGRTIQMANINSLKADIYYQLKNYASAEEFYENALRDTRKIFSELHPDYVKLQGKLARTYFMQGDKKKALGKIEETLDGYRIYIREYFPALSEREKAKFWNTIKTDFEFFNTLALQLGPSSSSLYEQMYNNAIKTKALLLNTSIKIRQRIANSNDQELKALYNEWLDKKELLTQALALSLEDLQEMDLNPQALANECELLEKQISERSEEFASGFDKRDITWDMIANTLKPNEVAVEMIRFRVFDHTFTDSVVYACLYITPETKKHPEVFTLTNGKNLEGRFYNFYRNAIKFSIPDPISYGNYWEPFATRLSQSATIYLSPDGIFNQINLEAIPVDEEKYVLDQSNIILVSNTKDLLLKKVQTQVVQEEKKATFFGNPTFYVDANPAIQSDYRRKYGTISQLPGTEREVVNVSSLFRNDGWEVNDYVELEAAEQQVKALNNPKVFHIATHGFFTSQTDIEEEEATFSMSENTGFQNPMLRAGLMLTGAGDVLDQSEYNYNIENGILTAYEAMTLNLDQTELVVLSACETGLGDIEAGEGVYGLQRAFLVAGAETLIISLFKVSDAVTTELMEKFYEKWFQTGNKRQAFTDAKKEIRNEYRDPIYWGPFIMIGLD